MSEPLIIQVLVSDIIGGCEILTESLMDRIRDRAQILVLCPPGTYADILKEKRYRVKKLEGLKRLHRQGSDFPFPVHLWKFCCLFLVATFQLLRIILHERPLCVQANNVNAGVRVMGSAFLARTLLRPFLGKTRWLLVNHNAQHVFREDRFFDTFCAMAFHKVIVVSSAGRKFYPSFLQSKVTLIYNGVDADKFRFDATERERFRRGYRLAEGTAAIGIIGRVSEAKGQKLLLRAFDRLQDQPSLPPVSLFIVGGILEEDKSYLEDLRVFIARRGLGDKVHFLGQRNDVPHILPGLDVVVSASSARISEALGLSLVEAMACGRIVVAPATGGIPEVISHGEDGFVYKVDNVDDLATKLGRVLQNLSNLEATRRVAVHKAGTKFGIERMVREYLDLFGLRGE